MILGLILPACGTRGPAGLPAAVPLDLANLRRPASPNTALAAPPNVGPVPDIASQHFDVPPPVLYAALRRVAETELRVFLQERFDARLQAAYVARSAFWNFPDLVQVAAVPDSAGSRPVIYSRSVYGRYDFGVNRRRAEAWLARLPQAVAAEGP
ncbi:MAG: DUF1499 domain-containing protein [Pseudomonadota bacterium]|nr:DUF1499 domain-containing protein [Pseudomonadota bacterium]